MTQIQQEYRDLLRQIRLGLDVGEIEREDVLIQLFGGAHGRLNLTELNFTGKLRGGINLQGLRTDGDLNIFSCKIGGNLDQHNQDVEGDIHQDWQRAKGRILQGYQTAKEVVQSQEQEPIQETELKTEIEVEQEQNENENNFTCEVAAELIREALETSGIDVGFDFEENEEVKTINFQNKNGEWIAKEPITEQKIKDSGTRREFSTGAVRDMAEGKGRCDLLPFNECAKLCTGDDFHLGTFYMFETMSDKNKISCLSLLSRALGFNNRYEMLLEVAIHFEDGAKKYGDNNWQKGIPRTAYMDSATRHYLKYKAGHTDERHDRACMWNMLCLWWTINNIEEFN